MDLPQAHQHEEHPRRRRPDGLVTPPESRGPLDPRLVQRAAATRWYLVTGVAIGCAMAALTVVQADVLARAISGVFDGLPVNLASAALVLAGVFTGKAALTWLNAHVAHRAAAAVKSQLRLDLMRARLARPLDARASTSGLVTLVTQGLDALDGFYGKYLPQLLLAVTVPLIIVVAIASADLGSALIVTLTLPLIPLFMALVGWTTEARTRRRWVMQQRLARHFADLVAGLPTLQVFGRARAQAIGLRRTQDAHQAETVGTLRISFLSALVLELVSTLSVAVVAVTIGFRVVAGHLDLQTALFVLVLAPEAYLPLRQVGAHYHDSAEGMAAAQTAFALIDAPAAAPEASGPRASGAQASGAQAPTPGHPAGVGHPAAILSVQGLGHTYEGADRPAVAGVDFDVAPGEFVALTGWSGGGKTTVVHAVLGFLQPTTGRVELRARGVAYVGQAPGMISGTVADNVLLGDSAASPDAVRTALARAGAPGIDPARPVGDEGEGLSAGERRRVAAARALLRVDAGADLVVLDEPTAGLDAEAEAALLASLRSLRVAVLLVTHRLAVLAQADRVVTIGGGRI